MAAALAALDEALTWMGQTGVRMLEAEAHRLRGELLLIGPPLEPRTDVPRDSGGRRSMFSPCDRRGPTAGRSMVGTASHGQPVPVAQGTGTNHKMRVEPKLTRYWLRSTADSPRGSTPRICERRERCWKSSNRVDARLCGHDFRWVRSTVLRRRRHASPPSRMAVPAGHPGQHSCLAICVNDPEQETNLHTRSARTNLSAHHSVLHIRAGTIPSQSRETPRKVGRTTMVRSPAA